MSLNLITKARCEWTLTAEQDDTEIRGNAMCSGDSEIDNQTEQWIRSELDSGNVWAWAIVTVTARWRGFTGSDSLGCCSYESEQDFRDGPYYKDMQIEALRELNRAIQAADEDIARLR